MNPKAGSLEVSMNGIANYILWSATIISGIACMGSVQAHHSSSMFDLLKPIWVEATFVRFDRINPHSRIMLEETAADGQTIEWIVEGPALFQLIQRELDLDLIAGDVIELCGFALKNESRAAYNGFGQSRFVHGHVLVMPDGDKMTWGSYGSLGECIRTRDDEPIESWLEFLNEDSVRMRWCQQRTFSKQVTAVSKAFVEEVNSLMNNPCE